MMNRFASTILVLTSTLCTACSGGAVSPATPSRSDVAGAALQQGPWGPETPKFNLEVILRSVGDSGGFGHVTFRQPNDDQLVIKLDTWVRDLQPNTTYLLQRAVDTNVDGVCTGTAWLTLGSGTLPQPITTDDKGTGRAELFRDVSTLAVGATFDIYFRVVEQTTSTVVLQSDCYQYTVSQ